MDDYWVEVVSVRRVSGVAGQVAYEVVTRDPFGEQTSGFVGSTYGAPGPVFVVCSNGMQLVVNSPERFGERLDESWVRAYWA